MQRDPELFTEKVSLREKLIFAAGDLYGGGAPSLINALYFGYLVAMGVGTVWAGAIVAIGRVWDAVSDPIMGVLSDKPDQWAPPPLYPFRQHVIIASFAFFLPMLGPREDVEHHRLSFSPPLLQHALHGTDATPASAELATLWRPGKHARLIFPWLLRSPRWGAYLLTQFIEGNMNVNTLYFHCGSPAQ